MFGVLPAMLGGAVIPPLPLADIAGGYDASVIGNVQFPGVSGTGEKIDTWFDTLSGSFRDFTNSTGATQARWFEAVQNGLGAIRFDRALSTVLNRASIIVGTSPCSMYAVLRVTDAAAVSSGIWTMGSDFQDDFYTSNLDRILIGAGSTARKTVTVGGSQPIVRTWHLLEIHSAAADWELLINGVQIFQTATNTPGYPATMEFGSNGADAIGMDFGQFVAYDVDHSALIRADVRANLSAKWALGF